MGILVVFYQNIGQQFFFVISFYMLIHMYVVKHLFFILNVERFQFH